MLKLTNFELKSGCFLFVVETATYAALNLLDVSGVQLEDQSFTGIEKSSWIFGIQTGFRRLLGLLDV